MATWLYEMKNIVGDSMTEIIMELGKKLTPPKVAKMMKMDVQRVRRCYAELGGFILGGRIYFYEEGIRHAIQNKIKQSVDGTGNDKRKESKSSQVQDKKGSSTMGEGRERKVVERPGYVHRDPFGLLA